MKKILIIIDIVLVIIVGIVGLYYWKVNDVLNNFQNAMVEFRRNGNYYCSYSIEEKNYIKSYEEYGANGKSTAKYSFASFDTDKNNPTFLIDTTTYKNGNENVHLNNIDKTFEIKNRSFEIKTFIDMPSDIICNFSNNLDQELYMDFMKFGEFEGRKCYILTSSKYDETFYIDRETYLPIGIKYKDGKYYNCKFETNTTKESDIVYPDLTGYAELNK